MPMIWNEATEAKLFVGVLTTSIELKIDYKKLAEYMGNDCTPKALTHRITNIKARVRDMDSNATDLTPAPKTPKTPQSGMKRKAKKNSDSTEDGDASPSQAKKLRTPVKAKANGKANVNGTLTSAPASTAMEDGDADGDEEPTKNKGDTTEPIDAEEA